MSYDWEIKEGDSLPELEAQIRDPSGDVADLTNAQSVEFRMAHVRTDTLLVATNATISDGATGRVTYDLKTEDTGMEGLHAVEWRVTRSSGETYSYPQNGNQEVFIHEGVGRDLSSVSTPNGDYTVDSLTADSISTENLSTSSMNGQHTDLGMHAPHKDAPTGTLEIGRSELPHSPEVIGNLQQAYAKPMSVEGTQGNDFTTTSGSWTVVRFIPFLSLNVPPNKVPVLRCFWYGGSDTAGETADVRIGPREQGAGNAPIQFTSVAADTADDRFYQEIYLDEYEDTTAVRADNQYVNAQYVVWAKATNATTCVIKPASSIVLDWEVV